ncbi:MAG: DUF6591 domain-containing protein [Flavobacterium sp.]
MKRNFILLAAIAVLSSCNGKKETASTELDAPTFIEEPATELVETSSETDYDQVLNDYENFVDQYIELFKKSKSGDMDALKEYPSIMEKAEELNRSLAEAKDSKLNPKQIARMMEIQTKMIKAMQ